MEDINVKLVVLDSGESLPIEVIVHWDGNLVYRIEPIASLAKQLTVKQWNQIKNKLNTDESFKLKLEKERKVNYR